MYKLLTIFALTAFSVPAFAQPGSQRLVCKSARHSGSKQVLTIDTARMNGTGYAAPDATVTVNGKKYVFVMTDENKPYGESIHNAPLGVVYAEVITYDEKQPGVGGNFNVTAIPSTVKAFDRDGKPVTWSLQREADECSDAAGRARFQGVVHGTVFVPAKGAQKEEQIDLETQILNCELTYDSGSAC